MAVMPGQVMDTASFNLTLKESRIRLWNTSLFGEIQIKDSLKNSGSTAIIVELTERWYIFPAPVIELADRNFNTWWEEYDRDLSRINFGLNLISYNTTGNYDKLEGIVQYGFTPKVELLYKRPYINKSRRHGVGAFLSWSSNKKIPYTTEENKELFFSADDYQLNRFRAYGQFFRRTGAWQMQAFELKYNRHSIKDSLRILNSEFLGDNRSKQEFFTFSYIFTYNQVDNKAYPLKGFYTDITARKIGLGIFNDLNQWSVIAKHNQYISLPWKSYIGLQAVGKFTYGKENPYFNLEGLGYCQDFVRGYELYVIEGQHYGFLKANLKKKLFDFSIGNPLAKGTGFSRVPFSFYLKTYSDLGYVYDNTGFGNGLANELLLGGGIGLDVVTFYDWVFRFEYSFNRLGENGLFLHWVLDLNSYENCNLW
ncbi:MAG: outer membrane protein assembly factor BamA [Limisphaerales bacterium]|jgi:outer membrane protein assembly factor BamA